jgi:predicted dehydrogenase
MASPRKKGIGIIGYGGFGEFIHRAWDQMEECGVVAICDADRSRDPGNVAFYTDYRQMLANPNVDIVSVATPPSSHKDLSILAMEAGKHVLVEKPLAICLRDALLIKRVAEQTGRVATVNFVLRFNPIVELLREIVRNEVLGKVRRADLRNYAMQDTVPEGHWFWDPTVSGRILVEHGVHFFDLASWVVGSKAAEAWSLGVERKPGMEDRVLAAVKYENDVVGTFWHSFSRPRELERTSFHFAFDLGEIDVYGWIPLEMRIWGWTDTNGTERIKTIGDGLKLRLRKLDQLIAKSSEFEYKVEYELDATIELASPKLEVYTENLQAIMSDLIHAVDDPSHEMRVSIEDAIEAVRVAEKATQFAHPSVQNDHTATSL